MNESGIVPCIGDVYRKTPNKIFELFIYSVKNGYFVNT
jgi:hypothetical protein